MVETKNTYEEYLKEVDRNVNMIPLTFDVVLKGIFERNRDLLKKFVVSVLKLELDIDDTTIELSNN